MCLQAVFFPQRLFSACGLYHSVGHGTGILSWGPTSASPHVVRVSGPGQGAYGTHAVQGALLAMCRAVSRAGRCITGPPVPQLVSLCCAWLLCSVYAACSTSRCTLYCSCVTSLLHASILFKLCLCCPVLIWLACDACSTPDVLA